MTSETEKPKWTPGPWRVRKFNDTKSWTIYADGSNGSLASVKAEANAHLIAAAPDLYAALDEAVNYLAVWAAVNGDEKSSELLSTCTAALAKATGAGE